MSAPPTASPIDRFVSQRRARWERLAGLLERATGGRKAPLSIDELEELLRLYRLATTDLAVARREFPGDRITLLINQLVARTYGYVYRDVPSPFSQLRRFYGHDLPIAYRSAWPFLATAAALLFIPWLAAMLAIIIAPATAALMLPPGLLAEIQGGHTWLSIATEERPAMSSFIMTNNVQVSILALGGGIFAGLGTIYVLLHNGISLGATTGALIAYHLQGDLLAWIGPHTFLELSVVVASGASGLMIGHAVVWPGLRPRGEALADAAGRSVRLLLGLLPFLVLAGLLEGFVSPSHLDWRLKMAIGLATAIGLYGYLLLVGRSPGAPVRDASSP
jgi:uncharacterized membrane protein SpoIIM required for sporulation